MPKSAAVLLCLALSHAVAQPAAGRIALAFRLGATDTESTAWDGELLCPEGVTIEEAGFLDFYPKRGGFRLAAPDRAVWQGGSRREVMRDYFQQRPVTDLQGEPIHYPLKPCSFVVQFAASRWQPVTVKTANGEFSLNPGEIPYGRPASFLAGRVQVERSLPTLALGNCRAADGGILYNDFPAICATADGATWTAFLAYRGRPQPRISLKKDPTNFAPLRQKPYDDQLLVVREQAGIAEEPMAVTTTGLNLFAPAIAARPGGGPLAVWSQETGGRWALHASILRGGRWTEPARLTDSEGPDLYPALAPAPDGYWLAWQSHRDGTFRILLARLDEATLRLAPPIEITDGDANGWMPSLAVDRRGTVAVAYDTYAKGDYDVQCALLAPGAAAPTHVPVAASLRFEAKASVAFDAQDRLWIAWEEAGENWGKDAGGKDGSTTWPGERIDDGRTLRVACLEEGRLRIPAASLDPLLPLQQNILVVYGKPQRARERIFQDEARYAYYPRLAATADGRICLAFRQHDYQPDQALAYQTIWSNFVTVLDGDRWTPPALLVGSSGYRHCAPAICALPGGGVAVAGACDGRASAPRQQCEQMHNVRLARFLSDLPRREAALVAVPATVAEPSPLVAAEREAVRRLRGFRTTVSGTTYRILRGDFHRHTTFSSDSGMGDGCIDDAFRYALDAASLDTMGNGDHDNGGGFEYPWYVTQKFYDAHLLGDRFVPMYSYERSVTANGPQGHKNILMPERGVRVLPVHGKDNIDADGSIEDTRLLFQFLREHRYVSIPHTIATGAGGNFVDDAPDVNCVVEIYQGARNAYEYPGCPRGIAQGNDAGFYWTLLKQGRKFGVIASSDHRSTHMSYAMLYVAEPTREGVMEAFRRRHCYAATDNILLDVRIGPDHMMGDELALADALELTIHAVGTGPIRALDIIRNAEIHHTVAPGGAAVDLVWRDPAPVAGESSYYVRILQENGEIAWGTPLWVRRE